MVNKEKLLLLAAIYMLLPGAMPDALADASESGKTKTRKPSAVRNIKVGSDSSARIAKR